MNVHVRQIVGADEDAMGHDPQIGMEILRRVAVSRNRHRDVGDFAGRNDDWRILQRVGPNADRAVRPVNESRGRGALRAGDVETKDLTAETVRHAVDVDVISSRDFRKNRVNREMSIRLEPRVNVLERREVVGHDDHVHQLRHVDVVGQNDFPVGLFPELKGFAFLVLRALDKVRTYRYLTSARYDVTRYWLFLRTRDR